jgi:hypothetical protein
MRARCDATIICNNFARWLQKIVATWFDAMCWVLWDATIICNNFMHPKEDFGRLNKPFGPCFKSTFHIREYSIWATDHWKVLWNAGPKCLFCHPKSSFGEHKLCKMITKDSSNVMCWFSGMCWVFWDAMIFCNNFSRWLQKIVATWCVGFLGCVGFSGMLWSFVTTLQDDYKR